jgi:hypothetical protein
MSVEIKISVEGPEDEAMEEKEDEKKAAAKKAALKSLLSSPSVKSDSSLAALVELLTKED